MGLTIFKIRAKRPPIRQRRVRDLAEHGSRDRTVVNVFPPTTRTTSTKFGCRPQASACRNTAGTRSSTAKPSRRLPVGTMRATHAPTVPCARRARPDAEPGVRGAEMGQLINARRAHGRRPSRRRGTLRPVVASRGGFLASVRDAFCRWGFGDSSRPASTSRRATSASPAVVRQLEPLVRFEPPQIMVLSSLDTRAREYSSRSSCRTYTVRRPRRQ